MRKADDRVQLEDVPKTWKMQHGRLHANKTDLACPWCDFPQTIPDKSCSCELDLKFYEIKPRTKNIWQYLMDAYISKSILQRHTEWKNHVTQLYSAYVSEVNF